VITDPSYNALSVARKSAALAGQLGIEHIILVVNRVNREADLQKVREKMGGISGLSGMVSLAFDPGIVNTDPGVYSLLQSESKFVKDIKTLSMIMCKPVFFQRYQNLKPGTFTVNPGFFN